jgi:hypothetical protein
MGGGYVILAVVLSEQAISARRDGSTAPAFFLGLINRTGMEEIMMAKKVLCALLMVVALLGGTGFGWCGQEEGGLYRGMAAWGEVKINVTDKVAELITVRRITTTYTPSRYASSLLNLTAYGFQMSYGDHAVKLKARFFVTHADGSVEELWGSSSNNRFSDYNCYRQRKEGIGCQEFMARTFSRWDVAIVTVDDGTPSELKVGQRRTVVEGKKGK